jgi:putative endonuclease
MAAPWYVYLLECADGSLYCGVTTNLENRLAAHNGLLPGGARYTRSRRPVRLAGYAASPDKGAALRLENLVRREPRARKMARLQAGLPEG